MYKKILVPVDGSSTAKLGLNEAIRLAKHHKARLRLVHVVDLFIATPTPEVDRYVDDMQKSFRGEGGRRLKKAEALVRKHNLAVDTVMIEFAGGRRAAEIIVAQAKKWRADVIVIGTHGRRGIRRLVLGSDAEQIIRTSPVPVLVVRSKTSGR